MVKWRQCEDKGPSAPPLFDFLEFLGAPPYRYYRIELDGNTKNGPEDMIYHNMPSDRAQPGRTGYAWVDLENCEIKNGFTVTGALERISKKTNAVYLNTLVYYKGELLAADFVDGFGFSLTRWLDRGHMESCYWLLFRPE